MHFGPRAQLPLSELPGTEFVLSERPLRRIMAFSGRSIDEIVNCPIAKREVARYFKIGRMIERRSEMVDLEEQWNPLGRQS